MPSTSKEDLQSREDGELMRQSLLNGIPNRKTGWTHYMQRQQMSDSDSSESEPYTRYVSSSKRSPTNAKEAVASKKLKKNTLTNYREVLTESSSDEDDMGDIWYTKKLYGMSMGERTDLVNILIDEYPDISQLRIKEILRTLYLNFYTRPRTAMVKLLYKRLDEEVAARSSNTVRKDNVPSSTITSASGSTVTIGSINITRNNRNKRILNKNVDVSTSATSSDGGATTNTPVPKKTGTITNKRDSTRAATPDIKRLRNWYKMPRTNSHINDIMNRQFLNDPYYNQDVRAMDLGEEERVLREFIGIKEEESEDEAEQTLSPLCCHMMEIFPDACPKFLRRMCKGKAKTEHDVEKVLNTILGNPDYPKRITSKEARVETTPDQTQAQILESLEEIFPDADPSFMQMQADAYVGNPDGLQAFIADNLEHHKYPTKKDALRKEKLSAQIKQYTESFDPERFLEVIPEPNKYFKEAQDSIQAKSSFDVYYTTSFFKNQFPKLNVRSISVEFRRTNYNVMQTWKLLKKMPDQMKSRRKPLALPSPPENIPLLQELAYLEHYEEIQDKIKLKEIERLQEIQAAKDGSLMKNCNCCYDDEVLPKDIVKCDYGCEFCKSCVEKSVEVAFGEGKLDYSCLQECAAQFSIQTLQAVLKPNIFSKIAQRKQLQEIKAAGIEDLETCPFCDFATIPPQGDKIFKCLNPDCMKESCRECKEPSHVPYRCDEVERDADVRKRTYIEDKMTEALLRKCYKCGMKFIKEDGCNKMTCQCGAMMCYICQKPVKDYKHFNGQGGDKTHLCPLYSDTHKLHEEAILKSAEEAKVEVGATDEQLKIDPTVDIKTHYENIRKRNPTQANIPHVPINLLIQNVPEINLHINQAHVLREDILHHIGHQPGRHVHLRNELNHLRRFHEAWARQQNRHRHRHHNQHNP